VLNRLLATIVLVAATTAPAFADASSDLKNAMIGFMKLTSYHMDMTFARGAPVSADVVNPGSYHTFSSGTEAIVVKNTMYLKLNGAWRKYSSSVAGLQPDFSKTLAAHNGIVATDLGPRTVGGALFHAYGVKNPKTGKVEKIYLDGSGRIARIEADTVVMKISRFNAPMTIKAPI
jgi:hypothetical protein